MSESDAEMGGEGAKLVVIHNNGICLGWQTV